jgi:hypothetical protein
MQIILQDVLNYYLPMVRGIPHGEELKIWHLVEELMPTARAIGGGTWSFAVVAFARTRDFISRQEFVPVLMIVTSFVLMATPVKKNPTDTAIFKIAEFEVGWKGSFAFGVLVSGVMLLALEKWTTVHTAISSVLAAG